MSRFLLVDDASAVRAAVSRVVRAREAAKPRAPGASPAGASLGAQNEELHLLTEAIMQLVRLGDDEV